MAAVQDAVAIGAYSTAEFFPNDQIISTAQQQLFERLVSFSINARRALEILNVRNIKMAGSRWKVSAEVSDYNPETDVWQAINAILHARHMQVFVLQRQSEIMLPPRFEFRFTFLEVQSDRSEKIHVDPFAMTMAYLDAMSGHFPEK